MNESTLTKALKAIATHETVDGYDGTENGDIIGAVCYNAYYVIHGLKARVKELEKELETARVEPLKEFAKRLKTAFLLAIQIEKGMF